MSLRQWLWLALLSSFWGSAFIFMEVALPTFSPVAIVMSRMGIAAIVLSATLQNQSALRDKLRSQPISTWLKCGGLSLLNNLLPFGLVVWGQQHISASLASILIAAAPLFTVVLAVFILRERLTWARAIGAVIGFGGVVILIGPEVLRGFNLQGLGEIAILGAALSYAIGGFVGRRFHVIPAQLVSTMTVTMGALIMIGVTLVAGWLNYPLLTGQWQWSAGLALLALGIFPTAMAYLIYYRLLSEAGVVNTSLVSFLVPLSALVLSALILHERLDPPAILGMGLILTGLAVIDGRLFK
ncbi:MAG: DMT family transporter [Phormidesmis sp. RL_2_1]|nr:DMT family transporter [Phormidesmis sp. RL_2_1]